MAAILLINYIEATLVRWYIFGPVGSATYSSRWSLLQAIAEREGLSLTNYSMELVFGFRVRKFGRLGNNIVQLARVLCYCERLGVGHVFLPSEFLFFRRGFVTENGVEVHLGGVVPDGVLSGFFFSPLGPFFPVNLKEMCGYFKSELLRCLPRPNVSDDVVYVHLRGGDIFSTFVHYLYAQPPCYYYLTAVKFEGVPDVELVSEDRQNPCFRLLVTRGFRHSPHSVEYDFARLVYARRLVISSSSFCRTAVYVSPVRKSLYTFNYPWVDVGSHWECAPDEAFREHVLGNWTNSPEQIKFILNSTCFWKKIGPGRSRAAKRFGSR